MSNVMVPKDLARVERSTARMVAKMDAILNAQLAAKRNKYSYADPALVEKYHVINFCL